MGEIQNLSKQTNFNSLIYYFKSNSDAKNCISFKCPLSSYKNIKDGYTALERAE